MTQFDNKVAINWFPGHMHKAQKELRKALKFIDVVIEVVDARLPLASQNTLLHTIFHEKPIIILFNKIDLVDKEKLNKCQNTHFDNCHSTALIRGMANSKAVIEPLIRACKKAAPTRNTIIKPLRVAIVGIPNVGKSTLINTLSGRKIAKVGNTPAVTRSIQKIQIREDILLIDSPGIMMPRAHSSQDMVFLAAIGCVGARAIDEVEVVLDLLDVMKIQYPNLLMQRYGLSVIPGDAQALLSEIAQKIGAIKGRDIYWEKAAAQFLYHLRSGAMGQVCFV